jgi:hypothetical protein
MILRNCHLPNSLSDSEDQAAVFDPLGICSDGRSRLSIGSSWRKIRGVMIELLVGESKQDL